MRNISESQYEELAKSSGLEVALIKAVEKVEGNSIGFRSDGKLLMAFEGHIFWNQLKKKGYDVDSLAKSNEDILYPKWCNKYLSNEYIRLEKATAIDEDAALNSASWGGFQIMGFNYKSCGYDSVKSMIDDFSKSEYNQLVGFIKFLTNTNIIQYLRSKDWTSFARRYNGPGSVDIYSKKLASAYKELGS